MCLLSALTGVVVVIYSFAGYIPKYRCRIPYCDGQNATYFNKEGEFPQYVIDGNQTSMNDVNSFDGNSNFMFWSFSYIFITGIPERSNSKNCTYLDVKGLKVRKI